MELRHLKNNIYYLFDAKDIKATNIGVIKNGNRVILIDSGLNNQAASKALNTLREQGLEPDLIISTHIHIDHCGGNKYFKNNTMAKIYIPELIELETYKEIYSDFKQIFDGLTPLKYFEKYFLLTDLSTIDGVIKLEQEKFDWQGIKLKTIPLPGHCSNQIGIAVDNILFCGDALFSEEFIADHKISFHTDMYQQKKLLQWLKTTDYDLYVPAHGVATSNINQLVKFNLKEIEEIEGFLIRILKQAQTIEDLLVKLCKEYGVNINSKLKYYIIRMILKGYLISLYKQDKLEVDFKNSSLYWQQKEVGY